MKIYLEAQARVSRARQARGRGERRLGEQLKLTQLTLSLTVNRLFLVIRFISNWLELEARVGIEPTHTAFAEPCLTTWLPRLPHKQY